MTTDDALGRERRIWDPILFSFFPPRWSEGGTVGEVGGNKVAAISSEEAEGKFLPSVRFSRSGIISFRLLERTKGGKGGGIGFAVSRNSRFIDSKSIDSRASESRAKY